MEDNLKIEISQQQLVRNYPNLKLRLMEDNHKSKKRLKTILYENIRQTFIIKTKKISPKLLFFN